MQKDGAENFMPAFYAGRSIFITGATGFMGKVLVEKLLRSCPDITEIFLLVRLKKGLNINERLKKTLGNGLFDKLRAEQPSCFDKLIPVSGDTCVESLGLLPADRQMLIEKVSVIFHVAANVRFDENLKSAIFTNTRSTRDICILAEEMKKLVALMHVSSTYTQADKRVVDEIAYPTGIDWRQVIKIAESVDDHILRIFTAKYIAAFPNTYTFTKRMAEQVITDYSETLPCIIFRPSVGYLKILKHVMYRKSTIDKEYGKESLEISKLLALLSVNCSAVISTVDDPVKGWNDNFNGPVGLMVGAGKGVLRVLYTNPHNTMDYVPVDGTIKCMIIAAWKRGIKTITEDNDVHVYNCSNNDMKNIANELMVWIGYQNAKEIPLEGVIWAPHTMLIKSYFMYFILMLLLHILPALFIDAILKLLNMRPMLLKVQRKVYVANTCLSYYMFNRWTFINAKLLNLLNNLSEENQKEFGFNYQNLDAYNYFRDGIIGGKIFLLKENMDNLEAAQSHQRRMVWVDKIVKKLVTVLIVWIMYRKFF